MTKTIIDIDDALMRKAMKATGSRTKKGAVVEALEQVVRRQQALQYIDDLADGIASDLDDPDVVRGAQR